MSEPVWADYPSEMLVSSSIFTQLPDWAKSSYQNFADFLEAYFEWMEASNNTLFHANKIRDYRDIDKTLLDFVQHFEVQYLKNVPNRLYDDTVNSGVKVDKATLLKNAKKFYSARGSEKSYKLLFRILFNEDVQFYYPKVDMLYASDGKWSYDRVIRISATNGDSIFDFVGKEIVGSVSSATAAVENAYLIYVEGTPIGELYLNNIIGAFENFEEITVGTVTETIQPILNSVSVTAPGTGYLVGDEVTLIGSIISMEAEVEEVKGPISTTVNILDPGSGYEDVPKVTIIGTGFGAKGHATLVSTGISRIQVLNGGSGFNDADPPIVVFPATVSTPTATATVVNGQVTEITLVTNGTGYTSIPEITLDDSSNGDLGTNALLRAYLTPTELDTIVVDNVGREYTSEGGVTINLNGGLTTDPTSYHAIVSGNINGGISKIKITNPGISTDGVAPSVSFPNASGTGASAIATVGGLYIHPGTWVTTDGFVSSDKYIQDSYYYQVFSYVLKSTQALSNYKDIVRKILHPAGLILFGTVLIENKVEIGPTHRTLERNKFWYPPYDGYRERPDYNLTFPAPNAGYWVSPDGLGNTQISNWLDRVIGSVTEHMLQRTNLAPDPYVNVYNPVYEIPEALVEYDMIEGADPQTLYDITADPTYNGTFGDSTSEDIHDPAFIATGVKFEGTYVDCSTVPINPLNQTVIAVFNVEGLTANTSIMGSIDVDKDTITTGYSMDVDTDGSFKMRVQMRTTTDVTYNMSAVYPAGTIVLNEWNMGVIRYSEGTVTANFNQQAPVVESFAVDPALIGIVNNSSGWYLGNQGYVPGTADASLYGGILYGAGLYFGSGSYSSTVTYIDSHWDSSLYWDKYWDGGTITEIAITEPIPGRPFLNGIIAYVLIYDRLLTDDEVTGVYISLKSALASRPVTLP